MCYQLPWPAIKAYEVGLSHACRPHWAATQLVKNNDVQVACLTESWLNDNCVCDAIEIGGFHCFRCDRNNGRGVM